MMCFSVSFDYPRGKKVAKLDIKMEDILSVSCS